MSEQNGEKSIRLEQNVNANIQDVWNAWTTEEGVKSFYAPACNIDLKVGGAYEMLFDLKAEPGLQGGEGLTIMVSAASEDAFLHLERATCLSESSRATDTCNRPI